MQLTEQLPFEVNKESYAALGFGTYLAYFSQLLTKPDVLGNNHGFLMNREITEEEKHNNSLNHVFL